MSIVEVPVGGEPIKYEMDKEAGTLVVDRFLYTSMRYPGNYGFIPHTLSGDGDPVRRADRQSARHRARARWSRCGRRRPAHAGRGGRRREDHRRAGAGLTRRYENVHDYTDLPDITSSRSSTSSSTTRISNPTNGSSCWAGATCRQSRADDRRGDRAGEEALGLDGRLEGGHDGVEKLQRRSASFRARRPCLHFGNGQ